MKIQDFNAIVFRLLTLSASLMIIASNANADTFHGHVNFTSNYVWRGQTHSNNNPAIQGGFDFIAANGFYAGIWASSVSTHTDARTFLSEEVNGNQALVVNDQLQVTPTNEMSLQTDFFTGIKFDFNKNNALDVGYIRYEYPKATIDFKEIYLIFHYKNLSAAYYQNQTGSKKNDVYLNLKANFNLPGALGLTFALGQTLPDDGREQVVDALIGFSKSLSGLNFSLAYAFVDKPNNSVENNSFLNSTTYKEKSFTVFSVRKSF